MPGLDTIIIVLIVFAVAVAALAFGLYGRSHIVRGCCGWAARLLGSRKGRGGETPPASDQALHDCLTGGPCTADAQERTTNVHERKTDAPAHPDAPAHADAPAHPAATSGTREAEAGKGIPTAGRPTAAAERSPTTASRHR